MRDVTVKSRRRRILEKLGKTLAAATVVTRPETNIIPATDDLARWH
jgi:hypothetical protein